MSMFAAKSDITMLTGKRTREEQSAELDWRDMDDQRDQLYQRGVSGFHCRGEG